MKSSPDGYQRTCRDCDKARLQQDWRDNSGKRRNSRYKHTYGIDIDTYNDMLATQGGKCKICSEKTDRRLAVDHCHTTGDVRGLLCQPCNLGLGQFKDNTDTLLKAIEYLKETQ